MRQIKVQKWPNIPEFDTVWVDKPVKVADIVTFKDSEDPLQKWEVLWVSRYEVDEPNAHRKTKFYSI